MFNSNSMHFKTLFKLKDKLYLKSLLLLNKNSYVFYYLNDILLNNDNIIIIKKVILFNENEYICDLIPNLDIRLDNYIYNINIIIVINIKNITKMLMIT